MNKRIITKSIMIMACCMLLLLTACEKTSPQQASTTQTTTEYSTVDGENDREPKDPDNPIDDGYWHDETTTELVQQSGSHTYTVYGDIQLTMDVNIDDYITTNDAGLEVFKLSHMAVDLGWWPDNINPESWSFGEYLPDMFTCPTGDMTVVFTCYGYEYNAQFQEYPQIKGFSYLFAENGHFGTPFYDGDVPVEKMYINASVNGHGADLQYLVPYGIGKSFMASRDDIIVLAYILTNIKRSPDTNPFVNTGLERYLDHNSGNSQEFVLP